MLFGDKMSAYKFSGILLALGGIIWYSSMRLAVTCPAPAAAMAASDTHCIVQSQQHDLKVESSSTGPPLDKDKASPADV